MMPGRLDIDRLQRGLNKSVGDRAINNYEAGRPQIQLWLRTLLNCRLSREEGTLPHPPLLLAFCSHHLLQELSKAARHEWWPFTFPPNNEACSEPSEPPGWRMGNERAGTAEREPGAPSGGTRRPCRVSHSPPEAAWTEPKPRKPRWASESLQSPGKKGMTYPRLAEYSSSLSYFSQRKNFLQKTKILNF